MDPSYNNVFYLSVNAADGSDGFTSHYFNISDSATTSPVAASRTTSSTALPTSSTTTTTPSASTTSAPTSRATVTVAPSKDSGTPIGTIAGKVVGIVVGTLVLAAAAWWVWKAKRRRNAGPTAQQPASIFVQPHLYTDREPKPYEVGGEPRTYEADGNQIHELNASGKRQVHELHNSAIQPRY